MLVGLWGNEVVKEFEVVVWGGGSTIEKFHACVCGRFSSLLKGWLY